MKTRAEPSARCIPSSLPELLRRGQRTAEDLGDARRGALRVRRRGIELALRDDLAVAGDEAERPPGVPRGFDPEPIDRRAVLLHGRDPGLGALLRRVALGGE